MAKKSGISNFTPAQLNTRLKKGELLPVYLLYGPEQGLLQAMAERVMEAAVPKENQPMLLNRLEGEKLGMDQLSALCRTVPFLGDRRCVAVSDFSLDKLGKSDGEAMKQLLAAPTPFTVLLLTYSNPELDLTKAKWKPYLEAIRKVGAVCEFAHKTPAELVKALCAYCTKRGGSLSAQTAAFLVDRCGVEYSLLTAEADKLLAYTQGREITQEDIQQLCSKTIERSAFDLAAALVEGRAKDAFTMLEELFALQQKPVMILGAVSASFFGSVPVAAGFGQWSERLSVGPGFWIPQQLAVGTHGTASREVSLKADSKLCAGIGGSGQAAEIFQNGGQCDPGNRHGQNAVP